MAGGVRKDLVMENAQLSIVLNASGETNKLDVIIPYAEVDQYELQGEKIALATTGDDATTYFLNTQDPMHMIHTLEFFINQYRAANQQEYIPGSTHGRSVQVRALDRTRS